MDIITLLWSVEIIRWLTWAKEASLNSVIIPKLLDSLWRIPLNHIRGRVFFIRLAFFRYFSIRLIRLRSIRLTQPNTPEPSTFSKKPRSRIICSRILFQKHDSRIIFSRVLFENHDSRILFSRVLFQNHESRIIYSRVNVARILNSQVCHNQKLAVK